MSCSTNVCGTGGWSGPKPGDPDNNSILTATPAFGGIDVNWSYPTTNPHAVAHTLLYRGLTASFESAIQIGVVAGSFYYDKQDNNFTHYYWIRIVSVNGTEGELIGPASAQARRTIEQTIEDLTGQIDRGLLAQSLKEEIDKITFTYDELLEEISNRIAGNEALSALLAEVQNGLTQSLAFIDTETTKRSEGDTALLKQINTLAALNQQSAAAIITERIARVDGDTALSARVDLVLSATGENAAAIQQVNETQTSITTALAKSITTVQATLNGDVASGQVGLLTQVGDLQGTVSGLGALYTAKVSTTSKDGSKLIGGFGVFNDGTSVEAGFDVDTFWVGRTNANRRKPFIIAGGEVFIDQAIINRVTFNALRAADGSVIVENGKIKANYLTVNEIYGGMFTGYAWPLAGQTGFYLGPNGLLLGNQRDNRFFQVTSTGDVFSPAFNIVKGVLSFGGDVIGTGALKNEAVNIFKLARGASLPDYVRTYKGDIRPAVPVNDWVVVPLDASALNNKINAQDYDTYRVYLPAGTYFYELSVPVKSGGSDTNDACYTAILRNHPTKEIAGVWQVISNAGANVVGDWQTATIFGVGRFTLPEAEFISVGVKTTDASPAMRVVSREGGSTTILRIWRDGSV